MADSSGGFGAALLHSNLDLAESHDQLYFSTIHISPSGYKSKACLYFWHAHSSSDSRNPARVEKVDICRFNHHRTTYQPGLLCKFGATTSTTRDPEPSPSNNYRCSLISTAQLFLGAVSTRSCHEVFHKAPCPLSTMRRAHFSKPESPVPPVLILESIQHP